MHEPVSSVDTERSSKPSRTYFPTFRTVFLAAAMVWGINRAPSEIGYWLLASAQNLAAAGDVSLAEQRATYAATWLSKSYLPYDVQSQIYLRAEQPDAALESLAKAMELSPENLDFKLRRVWIWLEANKTSEIEQEIARLAKLEGRKEFFYRLKLARLFSLRGDTDKALAIIDQIPYTSDEAAEVCSYKCHILEHAQRYAEALATCQVAVEMTGEPLALIDQQMNMQLHVKNPAAALKLVHIVEKKKFDTLWEVVVDSLWPSSHDRNTFAYIRSVANEELEKAEQQAEIAVGWMPRKSYMILDTRGFVKYRLGKFNEALHDLNEAIKLMENELAEPVAGSREALSYISPYLAAERRSEHNKVRAVVYYHRALIHQALQQQSAAEADLNRIKAFGIEPSEHLF